MSSAQVPSLLVRSIRFLYCHHHQYLRHEHSSPTLSLCKTITLSPHSGLLEAPLVDVETPSTESWTVNFVMFFSLYDAQVAKAVTYPSPLFPHHFQGYDTTT